MTSALEAFTIADPARRWTVREIAHHAAIGGRGDGFLRVARERRVLDGERRSILGGLIESREEIDAFTVAPVEHPPAGDEDNEDDNGGQHRTGALHMTV